MPIKWLADQQALRDRILIPSRLSFNKTIKKKRVSVCYLSLWHVAYACQIPTALINLRKETGKKSFTRFNFRHCNQASVFVLSKLNIFKKNYCWYFLVFNILTGDLWQVTKWRPWTLTTQHSQLCGRPLSPSTRITVKNVLRFGELTSWKTKKILTSVFCEACTRLVEPGSSMQKHRQPTDKNNTVTKIM